MNTRTIQITQADYNKLQYLLRKMPVIHPEDEINRQALFRELLRAEIRSAKEISEDVITLNSRARLRDLVIRASLDLTIVMPDEADSERGHVSVLAPLGTAILGHRKGDSVEWSTPEGSKCFHIEGVFFRMARRIDH